MDARITRIGDVALLFAAVVLGAVLAPVVSFVGLPLAAAGIAGLAYRGHTAYAAAAAAAGVAAVGLIQASSVLFVAPVLAAVVLTVVPLPRHSLQTVAGSLVAVIGLSSLAADALTARSQGTTLPALFSGESQTLVTETVKAMGSSASADTLASLKSFSQLLSTAWPSAYFQGAVFVGALVLAAVVWAARKADHAIETVPFSRLDLTPHVLWVFVLGLLMLAASYSSIAGSVVLGAVGLNLVLCARTLFFIQGFAVVAGLLDRAGVGLGGRILALAALAVLDALTMIVSFTGLLDFWINFRRLPREGAAPTQTEAEPDGRRW
jgi:hypothetical protein